MVQTKHLIGFDQDVEHNLNHYLKNHPETNRSRMINIILKKWLEGEA